MTDQTNWANQEQFNPMMGMLNYGTPTYQPPSAIAAGIGSAPAGGFGSDIMGALGGLFSKNSLFGGTDPNTKMQTQGWAMPVIGAASGIAQGLLGMKQFGLAQDQFKQSKKEFDLNYNAQKTLTNSQLEDRQRARVASNPNAYQSVGDYMNKNKVV